MISVIGCLSVKCTNIGPNTVTSLRCRLIITAHTQERKKKWKRRWGWRESEMGANEQKQDNGSEEGGRRREKQTQESWGAQEFVSKGKSRIRQG